MTTLTRVIVASLVALLALACAPTAPTPPVDIGPLVTVMTRGGECKDGPCGSLVAISNDGHVRQVKPEAIEVGTLNADTLTALQSAIATTDFEAIQAVPFTGECPTNFDGQEVIWEFAAPSGPVRIASCEVQVDPTAPVFVGVSEALASVGATPPTTP